MAFTPETVIASAVAVLQQVPGMGPVHDYRRVVRDEASLRARYFDGQRINGWVVTLADSTPISSDRGMGFDAVPVPIGGGAVAGTGDVLSTVHLVIEGHFGIDDAAASEKTFRTLCWAVARAFDTRGLIQAQASWQGAVTWQTFGYLMLADSYLVHFARLSLALRGRTAP